MTTLETPVLIVGGGGAGLTASMLLSKLGVESQLVNALPTTSILPKAHVLNQRAMAILTGVAEEIYRRGTPPANMSHSAYYAGFAGADPIYGRQIGRLECWGAGGLDGDWASASPCRQTNLPQIRLEPILRRGAEELAPGRVRFHHELVDLEQYADGVTATVLDSYEPERRATDGRNVQRSLENGMNHLQIARAIGISGEAGETVNLEALRAALADGPQRRRVLAAIATQSMEFREHAVEFGYTYESGAIVPDGTPAPAPLDPIRVYVPGTRPGVPLPHAWLDDLDGRRAAIGSLVRPGRFLLIAGEEGRAWCDAAAAIAADGNLPLDAIRIGHLDGDYRDPRCAWLARREIGPRGAVLVRPDRFVAWRSLDAAADPAAALASALSQVLGRSVAAGRS